MSAPAPSGGSSAVPGGGAVFSGRFESKVLLATGAGSGIAAAVARRFSAEGGRVAVLDLDGERAEAVASELPGSLGMACDVADEGSVAAAVARAARELGGIDCVFNAAGHADFGPIESFEAERFTRMLAVHVGGTFLVCKHAIPFVRERRGSIVNTASVAAIVAQPHNAPYGAAKGAIAAFTRQLARELAPMARVNVVAPGRVRTGMTTPLYIERGGGDYGRGAEMSAQFNVQHRIAEPEELAAAVLFLLSSDASFVTGATLVADGGETII